MKRFKKYAEGMLLVAFGLLVMLSGCADEKINLTSFDKQKIEPDPVIRSIVPAGTAGGGVSEIIIKGENFPTDVKDVAVYVNSMQAKVTGTSAEQIAILRPNISGDALTIKVVSKNALLAATLSPYKITTVQEPYGTLAPSEIVESFDVDLSENLYTCLDTKFLLKLTPDGQRSEFGTLKYRSSDVKIGPQGILYLFCGQNQVYRLESEGQESARWLTVGKRVGYGDFDENGNLYTAGKKTDIITIRPDESFFPAGKYADFEIRSLRVFDHSVYSIAEYVGDDASIAQLAIWKNAISADGQLGDSELVLDWASVGAYADSASSMYSITFSKDGEMYIGTNLADPILVMKNGTVEPLYPGILTPTVGNLVWGEGNYLYATVIDAQGSTRLIRIDVGKPGAAYFGRNL